MAPKITVCGTKAIEMAKQGAPLFVRSFQGWVPALPGTLDRAARMDSHALWIYGVCG